MTSDGRVPFETWLKGFKDNRVVQKIETRLERVEVGNFGDYKSLGNGLFELRIDYGAGYRIYFGQKENYIILLLCGGDKSRQTKDIRRAHQYWEDYRRENANQRLP